jgi:hypothetical protein
MDNENNSFQLENIVTQLQNNQSDMIELGYRILIALGAVFVLGLIALFHFW